MVFGESWMVSLSALKNFMTVLFSVAFKKDEHEKSITALYLFCFVSDGTILMAFHIIHGCTHDRMVADGEQIYYKLENEFDEIGLKFVTDSAICSSKIPYLIKSFRYYPTADDSLVTNEEG
jgi:hypothetical protein